MGNDLQKKYGLFTAIAMVIGIVIGSGVFFKAETINIKTGGNLPIGILAWAIGGIIMLACIYMFSVMARKYEKVNGIVDYAEATVGKKYGYAIGWFLTIIYYPTLTSVLAWLSARYTLSIFGQTDPTTGLCLALSCLFLCISYAVNALSPVFAGKFQVATTVIKLIPILIMAIVGTIAGIANGNVVENFTSVVNSDITPLQALFTAVVATSFAYEGWIIATCINAELKNAKKNLPIALIVGGIVIIAVYILYFIGLSGAVPTQDLMDNGVNHAFTVVFGNVVGTMLVVFIAISCMGTLNGLMLACVRGMYSVASRNMGPKPKIFKQIDPITNMPTNSSILGLLLCGIWLFFFYGANLAPKNIFGVFGFDSSELPIVTIYALYIPIFFMFMIKGKEKGPFKGKIMPVISIIASIAMIFAAVYAHGVTPYLAAAENGSFSCPILSYLLVFAVIMIIGMLFAKEKKDN